MDVRSILLNKVNGATFVGIDTFTKVPLRGGSSNPHLNRVTKLTLGSSVMVFQNKNINGYDAMVRRRLTLEGINPNNFVLSPRTWGKRVKGEPFVEYKGREYLEVIFLKAGTTHFFLDGNPIDRKDVIGLVATTEAHQGGLTDKVVLRTYAVDSIKAISVGNKRYV